MITSKRAPAEASPARPADQIPAAPGKPKQVRDEAFAAARRREIAAIIVDSANAIAMANATGIDYLRAFAPQGLIQRGQRLPEQVVRFINGLRDDLKRHAPHNSSLLTLPNGICMRGSVLAGDRDSLLVLFEPASRFDERNLSPRELEVATLVLNGLSNREIAAKLCVASNTVEGHLKRIFAKMQVRTRAGLVAKMLGWEADDVSKS